RIEVLRGPQGTLYGRNSNGGAINIVTRKPSQESDGYVSATVGDYAMREVQFAVGGVLADTLSGRISGRYDDRDGFTDWNQGSETFGDLENKALRGQLAYDGVSFSANLAVNWGRQEGTTVPGKAFGAQDAAGFAGQPCTTSQIRRSLCVDFDGFQSSSDPFERDLDADAAGRADRLKTDTYTLSLDLEWSFDRFDLTSITAFSKLEREWSEIGLDHTPTVSPYSFIDKDEEIQQFTQEFRITGSSSAVDWIVGLFYSTDDVETDNYIELTNIAPINDPVLGLGGLDLAWGYDQKTDSAAIFSNVDWRLSDVLTLVAGLRYSDETRDFDNGGTFLAFDRVLLDADATFFGTDFDGVLTPFTSQSDKIDNSQVSGKLGLDYRPTDDWLVYGSVSTGFKSGGFTGDFTFLDEELLPFDEEKVTAYEVGFKATLAGGKAQLNGAAFYYDYQDIQTFIPKPTGAFPLTNADEAEITGAEVDLHWRPAQGWDIRLGVGVLDTELDDPNLADELPNAADLQYTAAVRYEFSLTDGLMIALQGNLKYTDKVFREAFNDPVLQTDSYTLTNARVSLFDSGGKWELAVWGTNLGDEEYFPTGFDLRALNGTYMRFPGAPRNYGATFSYYFQ
ncbi:MAG: TonB-dependent receptor, partial [Planctomycetota bacterium]